MCNSGITQFLPATHTRTIPVFTPKPQSVTTLWLVFIASTHEEVVTYPDKCPVSDIVVPLSRIVYCMI